MKTLNKWMLSALATAAVVGCDPFDKAVGGPPAVIGAGFTDVTAGNCPDGSCIAYTGTGSGSVWAVPGVQSICSSSTAGQASVNGFIFVKFNKLLDGASIQRGVTDCTPAAALNLAVTPAAPAGLAWYACYNPQAPAPTEGASVIIFLDVAAPAPSGWNNAAAIPASGTVNSTVRATGTAHDKDGAAAPFDVTVTILPDPNPGTPGFSGFTPTGLTASWTPACVPTTSYDLQRAPDNGAGAPGVWATITPAGNTALTFNDTGLTTGNLYWYRVIGNPGTLTSGAAETSTAPAVPLAPTLTAGAAGSGSVTVGWAAVTGATSYRVQRAPDAAGVPGTFVNVATNLLVTSYTNTGLASGTTYWYRIVAVNSNAVVTATGASATTAGASASVVAP